MKETQYNKVLQIHSDGGWHCNNEYRAQFIFSPHKRREEMIKMKMCASFEWRPCEHGFANVRDYHMLTYEPKVNIPIIGEVKDEKVRFYGPRQENLLL